MSALRLPLARMLLKLLSRLPLALLYRGADILSMLARRVFRYRTGIVHANLKNAFPGRTEQEVDKLSRQFYRNFSDFIVEVIKGFTISPAALQKRVRFVEPEVVEEIAAHDGPILLLTTHQGNWEWLLLATCLKLPATVIPVYKPLHEERVDALMLELRSRFGARPIAGRELFMEIAKQKHSIGALALLADQVPLRDEEKYWTTFLNQETAFYVGTEKLAHMLKAPAYFVGMKRVKRGYYEVRLRRLTEPPYKRGDHVLLYRYVREAERLVLDDPSAWLWSHRRWKYHKPFYN